MTTAAVAARNTITLGGQEREIRFNFNALCRLEEQFGREPFDNPQAFFENSTPVKVRGFVYAALSGADPGITLEQVGAWLTVENMGRVLEAVIGAFNDSFGGAGRPTEAPEATD